MKYIKIKEASCTHYGKIILKEGKGNHATFKVDWAGNPYWKNVYRRQCIEITKKEYLAALIIES